jgi:hypothetical protein
MNITLVRENFYQKHNEFIKPYREQFLLHYKNEICLFFEENKEEYPLFQDIELIEFNEYLDEYDYRNTITGSLSIKIGNESISYQEDDEKDPAILALFEYLILLIPDDELELVFNGLVYIPIK